MIKSISFIVVTHLFQFNQLKIKATRLLNFLSKTNNIFYSVCIYNDDIPNNTYL